MSNAEAVSGNIPNCIIILQDGAKFKLRFQGLNFSRLETEIVSAIGAGEMEKASSLASEAGWLKPSKKGGLIRSRERLELEAKLQRLNLSVPWTE